jgi:hypothetical protein
MKEKILARQQELLALAKTEGRELTAEEQQEFNILQKMFEADEEGNPNNPNQTEEKSLDEVIKLERERMGEINSLCREFGFGDTEVKEFIEKGASVEEVRAKVIDKMRSEKAPVGSRCKIVSDSHDKFVKAASDALIMRSGVEIEKPAEGASQLRGMSLRNMAAEALTLDGVAGNFNRMSNDELYETLQRQFYNPTAAFPAILDNTINKAYVEGHKTVAVTFDKWTKKGSLKDFKTHDNYYIMGSAGEFLEVPEGGELKHDTFEDKRRPTRKLKTYGRQFSLTRQAFINDDIELVTRMPAKYAASARKTINKMCYEVLVGNSVIYDGTTLFNEAHSNVLATGTGITLGALQAMIMALQTQKDEFGEAIIIRPATLIVPSGYAFEVYTLFNSPTINTSDNTQAVNPMYHYKDSIEIVEDPTINVLCGGFGNVMPWWLVGSKDDTDFMEVDYLNGQEIPNIRRMEAPGTLGFVWDVYLDFGISVMDYRGAVKNPGIEVKNPLS